MKRYTVAIVGATGLVGRKMAQVLQERSFPVGELRPLASARSAGKEIICAGKSYPVRELAPGSFNGVEIALFSAGATVRSTILEGTHDPHDWECMARAHESI